MCQQTNLKADIEQTALIILQTQAMIKSKKSIGHIQNKNARSKCIEPQEFDLQSEANLTHFNFPTQSSVFFSEYQSEQNGTIYNQNQSNTFGQYSERIICAECGKKVKDFKTKMISKVALLKDQQIELNYMIAELKMEHQLFLTHFQNIIEYSSEIISEKITSVCERLQQRNSKLQKELQGQIKETNRYRDKIIQLQNDKSLYKQHSLSPGLQDQLQIFFTKNCSIKQSESIRYKNRSSLRATKTLDEGKVDRLKTYFSKQNHKQKISEINEVEKKLNFLKFQIINHKDLRHSGKV